MLFSENAMYLIVVNNSSFFIINRRRERMYREGSGEILSLINSFAHESLLLHPIIILITFSAIQKLLYYLRNDPKNYAIRHNKSFSTSVVTHKV